MLGWIIDLLIGSKRMNGIFAALDQLIAKLKELIALWQQLIELKKQFLEDDQEVAKLKATLLETKERP